MAEPAWHAEARALREADPCKWTIRALAEHFGKGRATVGELFKASPRVACQRCGKPVLGSARRKHATKKCARCVHALHDARRDLIAGLYNRGDSLLKIAATLGTTKHAISKDLDALRKEGRIGYRYEGCKNRA